MFLLSLATSEKIRVTNLFDQGKVEPENIILFQLLEFVGILKKKMKKNLDAFWFFN